MQSHYVDTAWGTRAALPWPGAEEFDGQGNLKAALDFTPFDNWAKDWPEARHFFVFINGGDNFAGEKMGTPLFDAKVRSWAGAIVAHMRKTGRDPRTVGLLILDEPHTDAADAIIAAWSNAINAAAPELQLFSDPLWANPEEMKYPEAFTNMDIISPNLQVYKRAGAPAEKYFENLRKQGKELWLYQCDGPARLFDPQRYYRYQAWHTFAIGGSGQGFWAFGDGGEAPWNEYPSIRFTYAPAIVDRDTVTNSIHWDAVREGMEDFEELAMLRDAVAATNDAKLRVEGQRVLDEAVRSVTGIWKDDVKDGVQVDVTPRYDWRRTDFDPYVADRALTRVRRMLEQFR
jgi:hypothetical protein